LDFLRLADGFLLTPHPERCCSLLQRLSFSRRFVSVPLPLASVLLSLLFVFCFCARVAIVRLANAADHVQNLLYVSFFNWLNPVEALFFVRLFLGAVSQEVPFASTIPRGTHVVARLPNGRDRLWRLMSLLRVFVFLPSSHRVISPFCFPF